MFIFHCSSEKVNFSYLPFLIKNSSNASASDAEEKNKKNDTNQIAQTAPTNLKTIQTADTIILSWNKVKDENGKDFSIYETSIDSGTSWEETSDTFYTFKKLKKNQKYSLQVRPKNNPKLTATISITLGDNPPTKPQNLKVTQVGEIPSPLVGNQVQTKIKTLFLMKSQKMEESIGKI